MRLISLNLCGYSDWEVRDKKIAGFLNEVNADVVCLQEVKFDITLSAYNQAEHLNSMLATPYEYSSVSVTKFYRPRTSDPFREGLAVLSRLPIVRNESLALNQAENDKHVRIIQNVDLVDATEEIKISNIHFSNNIHSTDQLEETLSIFDTRKEERIIVGDFNIFALNDSRNTFGEKYSSSFDFSNYISYPSKGQTLDYCLLPMKYSFSNIDVREGLSDHNALIVDFS